MNVIDFESRTQVQRWIEQEMKKLRYSLYKATCLADNGEHVQRYFIVLRDEYGNILQWTRLGNYVGTHRNLLRPLSKDNAKQFSHVIHMLNYFLCEADSSHHVASIAEITKPMLTEYFTQYAQSVSPVTKTYRSAEAISDGIYACTAFLSNLQKDWPEMHLTQQDLWREKIQVEHQSRKTRANKRVVQLVPNFEIQTLAAKQKQIFRDMPQFVLDRMFELAAQHLPQLMMPMALGAFAGLRPGECCQVQQERAGGIKIAAAGSLVTSIRIDLSMDKCLRSDGIPTGNIKKYRIQTVYPGFLAQFQQALYFQEQYLAELGFEPEFSPLVIDASGRAMTVRTYRHTFQKLVTKYLRPALLNDPDPRCQQYGQMLMHDRLSPHAMRHYFSVALVLAGENATQLQYYRGDSSPESAYVYLANKSELNAQYQQVSEMLLSDMIGRGEQYAGSIDPGC